MSFAESNIISYRGMTDSSNGTEDEGMQIMLASKPIVGWKNASIEWGLCWDIYVYCNIGVNAALVCWTIINIILIFRGRRAVHCRQYFLSLNFLVLLYGLTRIIYYAIDPKSIKGYMPPLAGNLLSNACFPILTVGFFMLYVALRQCTIPNRHLLPLILKPSWIVIFTLACFILSFATDVLVALFSSMQLMIMVCQLFYILWGIVFFCLYSVLVIRFKATVRRSKRKMARSCYKRGHCRRDFASNNFMEIPACMKIAYVSAILFLAIALFNAYLVLAEIGLIQNSLLTLMCDKYRKLWPFFVFHVTFIFVETSMAVTLVIAGTQPLKPLRLKKLPINSRTITASQSELLSSTATTATVSNSQSQLSTSVFTIESSLGADNQGISHNTGPASDVPTEAISNSTTAEQHKGLAYIQNQIYSKFPP